MATEQEIQYFLAEIGVTEQFVREGWDCSCYTSFYWRSLPISTLRQAISNIACESLVRKADKVLPIYSRILACRIRAEELISEDEISFMIWLFEEETKYQKIFKYDEKNILNYKKNITTIVNLDNKYFCVKWTKSFDYIKREHYEQPYEVEYDKNKRQWVTVK